MPDAVYANTDEIRALLPEFKFVEGTDKAGLLQGEASDIRDQLLAEAVASAMDIVWDSPGNPSLAEYLNEIETYGYSVTIAIRTVAWKKRRKLPRIAPRMLRIQPTVERSRIP
jgi:hypothetical protein